VSSGEPMNSNETNEEEDMVKQARQLLLLTDLVDKYPGVVSRRVAGLVYILIAGGISFATLILMSLQNILGSGSPFLINVGFVILSLVFSWAIGFRLIVPLTRSYPTDPKGAEGGKWIFAFWAVMGTVIVISSFILFDLDLATLFPPVLQLIMGFGFAVNYLIGRRANLYDFYSREHLYFSIAIFLSIIPMLIFPSAGYVFLIVVNMGGIYVIGIHMLITAERLLLESKGQG
jgi:hypothetical protein